MRKLHLEMRVQRGEKRSAAFMDFSNEIQAGSDFGLISIGKRVNELAIMQTDHEHNTRNQIQMDIETRLQEYRRHYEVIPDNEKPRAKGLIDERLKMLSPIPEADRSENQRNAMFALQALRKMLERE